MGWASDIPEATNAHDGLCERTRLLKGHKVKHVTFWVLWVQIRKHRRRSVPLMQRRWRNCGWKGMHCSAPLRRRRARRRHTKQQQNPISGKELLHIEGSPVQSQCREVHLNSHEPRGTWPFDSVRHQVVLLQSSTCRPCYSAHASLADCCHHGGAPPPRPPRAQLQRWHDSAHPGEAPSRCSQWHTGMMLLLCNVSQITIARCLHDNEEPELK